MPKRKPKPKDWYLAWVVRDWLTDPKVSLLKEATRGIWFDALCNMFMYDRCGQLVGTISDLARLCRTSANNMTVAIADLKLRNAADVDERGDVVTLTNRRMRREWTDRKSSRERKQQERERMRRGDVTPDVTDESPPHSNSHSHSHPPEAPQGGRMRKRRMSEAEENAELASKIGVNP